MARSRDSDKLNVLQQARDEMGFTLDEVAEAVGSNGASISRIERAMQMGRRELYRSLHNFYGGFLTLGEIYDPGFYDERLDEGRCRKLRRLAKSYRSENRSALPSLTG